MVIESHSEMFASQQSSTDVLPTSICQKDAQRSRLTQWIAEKRSIPSRLPLRPYFRPAWVQLRRPFPANLRRRGSAISHTLRPATARCCFKQYNMSPLSDRGFRCVAYDRRGHQNLLIKGSRFKVYPGAFHGLIVTHAEQLNSDLAEFAAV
jgi:hypothetical protein